jgi:peptidyl-prolyl cis-trans isomerase A (cyclophilin A)
MEKMHGRPAVERRAGSAPFEILERRQLLSATLVHAIPAQSLTAGAAPTSLTLPSYFSDPAYPGTVVQFQTTEGTFDVALTDQATPLTVANFMKYVTGGYSSSGVWSNGNGSGAYNGSFFHRSIILSTGQGPTPGKTESDIVQGGGYTLDSSGNMVALNTGAPVVNEVKTETEKNVRGTIAMAKTSDPNSATDGFFFNIHDNPDLDNTANSGGFTTFGSVIGNGLAVLDKLASLPDASLGSPDGPFTTMPVVGVTQAQLQAGVTLSPSNLAYLNKIAQIAKLSFKATSSNTSVLNVSVSGGSLQLLPQGINGGSASVTITATDLNGKTATTTFKVTVAPEPGSISGIQFYDANANGKYDTGDFIQAGWGAYIDLHHTGVRTSDDPFAISNANGAFTFSNLAPGTYTVLQNPPANWVRTVPGASGYTVTIGVGQKATGYNFGNRQASVSGTVFNDVKGTGVLASGDAGLAGWGVFVTNNGVKTRVFTDAKGNYLFPYLTPGTYVLNESTPTGYTRTTPGANGYTITVTKGQLVSGKNFGYHQNAAPTSEIASAVPSPFSDNEISAWDRYID